jgi:hypothetical protein
VRKLKISTTSGKDSRAHRDLLLEGDFSPQFPLSLELLIEAGAHIETIKQRSKRKPR